MDSPLDRDVIELAQASGGIVTASQLLALGRTRNWQSDRRRAGLLHRLSRGVYAIAELWAGLPPWRRYELWVRGVGRTWVEPYAGSRALSHQSAAVLWGLPLLAVPDEVHVVDARGGARRSRDGIRVHHSDLAEGVGRPGGLASTSLFRTVIDCCATTGFAQAVAVADAALAMTMQAGRPEGDGVMHRRDDFDENTQELHRRALIDLLARRRPAGTAPAREALLFADARSESPAESKTRVALRLLGYPAPVLQMRVRTSGGTYYPDFAFPDTGVLVEVDGAVKTREPIAGDAAASVERERRRHILLQEEGWEIVRFTWAEIQDLPLMRRKLEAASARARRRGLGG